MPDKEYVGEGVYIQSDPAGIVLTTENGITVDNTISLDLHLLDTINKYVERLLKGE